MADTLIPVTILTGFLGAGKTTLLNRALSHAEFENAAVLINEFGEVSVDHLIVAAVSDDVTELADGCMCCAVRGRMVDALRDLAARDKKPDRVIIETSGLADPAPVAEALLRDDELSRHFAPARIVTVVNLAETEAQLADYPEAERQIALADVVILTRAERLDETVRHGAAARIAALNPAADLIADPSGNELAGLLTGSASKTVGLPRTDAAHHHAHGTATSTIVREPQPVQLAVITGFCDWLISRPDFRLLRLKGTVATPQGAYLLQAVGRTLETPQLLIRQDAAEPGTMLVIIGEGLDAATIEDAFSGFIGRPVLDRPDRTALQDNPLSVAGFSFNP
ncbi:CobW family GTP-binding protein [Nitratireductor basaltis]|uniref:Cobalamin synthesis protein P47K n=1 Tax=Nitratireductor basaltis TaxID=472175 RepID=A0A084U7J7_9HYPH|nr:CobW family GTP-binding protein [Nitratireductor basaltis]KFB08933.1 Cobalamin synthesis protein P47K [Nitratireductor basaltis]